MNDNEHKLMIAMFASILGMHYSLLNQLKDRGILTEQDSHKLSEVAASLGPEKQEFLSTVRMMYIAAAKLFDLPVEGLEPPQSPDQSL